MNDTNYFDIINNVPEEKKRFINYSMTLSAKISDELKKLKLTQKELARLLGKKDSEISKWLSGDHNFTIKTISKIEAALNTSLIQIELNDFLTVTINSDTSEIDIQESINETPIFYLNTNESIYLKQEFKNNIVAETQQLYKTG